MKLFIDQWNELNFFWLENRLRVYINRNTSTLDRTECNSNEKLYICNYDSLYEYL